MSTDAGLEPEVEVLLSRNERGASGVTGEDEEVEGGGESDVVADAERGGHPDKKKGAPRFPCIVLLDSLGQQKKHYFTQIRQYLALEWQSRYGTAACFDRVTVPGKIAKVS